MKEDYRPHERGADDVGYHVAGFDKNRQPRLFHIFYGFERPPESQKEPKYAKYEHHRPGTLTFLYNGRNDLAEPMIKLFLAQLERGKATRFDLGKLEDIVFLSDFVVRFSAEITPEVGPPFKTFLITPDNQVETLINEELKPIICAKVLTLLEKLGCRQ